MTQNVIYSMTGFGAGAAQTDALSVRIEVKSVNNRGMKISVRSRPSLGVFEKPLRDVVTDRLVRGSVDVYVFIDRVDAKGSGTVCADTARAAVDALRALAADMGLQDTITARDLIHIPGVFETGAEDALSEDEWPVVQGALEAALDQVCEMRRTEGARLAEVLLAQAEPLRQFVASTTKAAPAALEAARQRLRQKLEDMFPAGLTQGDNQALEREMCLLADKADIQEELDRLTSHIGQYEAALRRGGEVGKRLDFLSQEFLREVNTTASKTNDTGIIQAAIAAKLTVEKIKEQSANLV